MLVTMPPTALASADSTWLQSRRTISSTSSTAKPCTERSYSLTIRMFSADGLQPTTDGRSITGTICPRILATPSTCRGAPGIAVSGGITIASRTLNTLMPKTSRRPPGSLPRRNSSSSNLLVPASRERSSTSCKR
ncbi:hypothetical protein GALL_362620 [mine drainage metagenome]|uniref:Uncharacterized protein n=1 Tax=mine drainage metagenome TaxID=410659 RepID=A0A1J5QFF6_9ZZZZ